MFEQTFKNIDDVLWKEAGCTTELDYTEQTSWMLFLKYLDDLEQERAMEAELVGKPYDFLIDEPHRWAGWAAPKQADGSFDHDNAVTGDDLIEFVNDDLFVYLEGFRERASGPDTIQYKIGAVFSEIKNRFQSGYSLRDALELIDELRFGSQEEKHELSHLYEAKIRNMGNAGRNGGEYYTPRPLIRAMVKVTDPKIGETVYDGACGSAGFLCESYVHLREGKLTTKQLEQLQGHTFFGKEKKSLAYIIGIMNMILHGIEAPNIVHTNTLTENLADIQEKDRFDVILANPPFGGKERKEIQQNFPVKTGETAFLFLQHFIKSLKAGGRGAVVIKNTFLSNSDNASKALRKELLESCNLHTVLDCPSGTFLGAGVKTVVLFFEKGSATRKTWFYQLDPGRNMGKTNPLNDDDLAEFIELQKDFSESEKSWSVDASDVDEDTFDLSVKNPNAPEEAPLRSPEEILADGKERTIQHMMVTSFWSPDGTPMAAAQFMEQLFGELPALFKDEDELRNLWSRPDTRQKLLEGLEEKGYGREQLTELMQLVSAEKSDLFDVLAYVAFALAPMSREDRVIATRNRIFAPYEGEQQEFLAFVLDHYVQQGVDELAESKLPQLLNLKYRATADAVAALGDPGAIRQLFIGFQHHLYAPQAVA